MRLRRRSQNKAEIRQLAATLMPRGLAYAPKVPQTVPIGHWFRGPLKDFLKEQLSSPRIKDSGLFNSTVVQRLLKEHINRENGHEWKLWAILTVLVWQDLVRKRRL